MWLGRGAGSIGFDPQHSINGVVIRAQTPITQEVKAERSEVQGHPLLYVEASMGYLRDGRQTIEKRKGGRDSTDLCSLCGGPCAHRGSTPGLSERLRKAPMLARGHRLR